MLLTVKDVAKLLRVNTTYVYNLINSGELPALKIGSWKVRKESLEAWLIRTEEQTRTEHR